MKIVRFPQHKIFSRGCVVTIGDYDALHLGHQKILRRVVQQAKKMSLLAVVITFHPMPWQYFQLKKSVRIHSLETRANILKEIGIDVLLCLQFNNKLSNVTADAFIRNILNTINMKHLVIGDDFRFGKDRGGDVNTLLYYSNNYGYQVEQIPCEQDDYGRFSSSVVRKKLLNHQFDSVRSVLGRPYTVIGRVRHGQKIGRTIGFPTLNILTKNANILSGVFAVRIVGLGHLYEGVASWGTRPTFFGKSCILEVYVFDLNEFVYGKNVHIEFVDFIRSEKKYSDVEKLTRQIERDVEDAKKILNDYK